MRFTRKPRQQRCARLWRTTRKKKSNWDKKATKTSRLTSPKCVCFKCKNCVNGKSVTLKHLWLVVLTAADTNRTVCRSANKFCARQRERIWFVFAVVRSFHLVPLTPRAPITILSNAFHYQFELLDTAQYYVIIAPYVLLAQLRLTFLSLSLSMSVLHAKVYDFQRSNQPN